MIGVYDSGYGGLSVLAALRKRLPDADFVYLGDNGRAPYGDRDLHTVLDLAEQCVERLFEENCNLIVVACHTISCVALRHLQGRYADAHRRVLGVTIPAAEMAIESGARRLAWLGTARTIASKTPLIELQKLAPECEVQLISAPLLAAIVEEGLESTQIARLAAAHYLAQIHDAQALVLGCTHYPLLRATLAAVAPANLAILDPSDFIAQRLQDWLVRHPNFVESGSGQLRVLSSGDPHATAERGARFLGASMPKVQHVAEINGRLAHRDSPEMYVGQMVRPRKTDVE